MRSLVVEGPDRAALAETARPAPAAGEVLIRIAAAGICGSDIDLLDGRRPAPFVRYPIVPGHEWAGTIAAVGGDVSGVQAGDPVVAEGFRNCGVCHRCREGRTNLCSSVYAETGFTHPGAFAEYVAVPARLVHRLPPGTPLGAAALLEPAACVANGLLEIDLRPGLSAAVVGAGTVGLLAVLLLKLFTPARLALVDISPARLARGEAFGPTEVWKAADAPARAEGQFDLVVEATTGAAGAGTAIGLCRRGGTVILEGIGGVAPAISADGITLGQLRVQGSFGASSAAWQWVVGLFASGLLDPAPLITHRFDLEDYGEAFSTAGSGEALKVQLLPNGRNGG